MVDGGEGEARKRTRRPRRKWGDKRELVERTERLMHKSGRKLRAFFLQKQTYVCVRTGV